MCFVFSILFSHTHTHFLFLIFSLCVSLCVTVGLLVCVAFFYAKEREGTRAKEILRICLSLLLLSECSSLVECCAPFYIKKREREIL